jgi:hypothetical protein
MGTSSSYKGPVGPGGLLPPWAPLPPEEGELPDTPGDGAEPQDTDEQEPTDAADPPDQAEPATQPYAWHRPKTAMKAFSTGSGRAERQRALGRAARGFVRAQGGARRAAASAPAGRAAGRNLAGFAAAVSSQGLARAAEAFGIDAYLGQGANAFLVALVEALAPGAGTAEEAAAHAAIAEALTDLFERFGVEESGLGALDRMSPETIGEVLQVYVAAYIDTRLMHVLGNRVETGAVSPADAAARELEAKDYVAERVRLDFGDTDLSRVDWRGPQADSLIERIFQEAYVLLEVEE